ncbi:uncharacterized protein LOC131984776 isoform X5 [Centropristis striata]|uniref:uncharacterized protein LOC131984776 isoform X5 n=1 Tax=Centropristis striata TaxID=184440 RepID=UPI0027DEF51F|nr:uncharacterized protein LOC131984776 isoform X5 [Centropristis striata]
MEHITLSCQTCRFSSKLIGDIKTHMTTESHRQISSQIFKTETSPSRGFFPYISAIDSKHRQGKPSIIGSSLLTLCYSKKSGKYFYLCHVCEETCSSFSIEKHLRSSDHCGNYFSYTNPNVLSFAWIPKMDWSVILKAEISKEVKKGKEELMLLSVPDRLMKLFYSNTYDQVMRILMNHDDLLKDFKSTRTTIQTYQKDGDRKHPLLGMQHIVELSTHFGPTEKTYYLCTLCSLTLAPHMIIRHVLSFDHIFCYFKAWHPSTLLAKESYKDYKSFAYIVLDLARQSEEIHGSASTHMKQVSLQPAKFKSVNFACYAEALKVLESIRKENQESSLITSIEPGNKLEYRYTVSAVVAKSAASPVSTAAVAPAAAVVSSTASSASAATTPSAASKGSSASAVSTPSSASKGSSASGASTLSAVSKGSSVSAATTASAASAPSAASTPSAATTASVVSKGSSSSAATTPSAASTSSAPSGVMILQYKLRCQNCSMSFKDINQFHAHLSTFIHKKMLKTHLGEDNRDQQTEYNLESTVVNEESKPCLGLNDYLRESMERNQPLIGVALVVACVSSQGEPIYICFACRNSFNESLIRQHVDSRKHLIHTLLYQNPWRLPFGWVNDLNVEALRSEAWEEEKARGPDQMLLKILDIPFQVFQDLIPNSSDYPEVLKRLGKYHTILKRDVPQCETNTKLQQNERFPLLGPGFLVMHDLHMSTEMGCLCSLCKRRLSKDESHAHLFSWEHVGEFLNRFHPGSVQPNTKAETLLDLAKQAARLQPKLDIQVIKLKKPIWEPCSYDRAKSILLSAKKKKSLAPEIMSKEKLFPRRSLTVQDHVRDPRQASGRLMKEGCEKTTSQKSDHGETALKREEVGAGITNEHSVGRREKGDNAETGKESEKRTRSEEVKTEEPIERDASSETIESCKVREKNDLTGSPALPQLTQKRKRSQEDTCPVEGTKQEMDPKRQRLSSKGDTSCEESQNLPSSGHKGESGKSNHEAAQDKGLSALKSQHDEREPFYLCVCCSLNILQKDFNRHVAGIEHQRMMVLSMETDKDPKDSETQPFSITTATSVITGTTSNTAKVSPESKEDVKLTHTKDTNTIVGTSQARTDCSVTTPTPTISKCTAKSSSSPPSTAPSATRLKQTAHKCTAATSTPHANNSSTTQNAKSVTISKPPESRTGAAAKAPAASHKVTPTSDAASTVVREATSRTAPASKTGNASQISENASKAAAASQTTVTKTSVKCDNIKASVKTAPIKNSVGFDAADGAPTIHKSKEPAAPNPTTPGPPPTQLSNNSASETKPSDSYPKVGRDQLIIVVCQQRRHTYCKLCSVRLQRSSHTTTFAHCYNYVKKMDPEWTAKPWELKSKVFEKGTALAEAEKKYRVNAELLEVDIDIYKELAASPEDKAIESVLAMLRHRNSRDNSARTWRQQVSYTSSCEASSPDDGTFMQKNEGFSPDIQSEQENRHELQSPMVQIPEIESSSKEEGRSPAVDQSESTQTEELAVTVNIEQPNQPRPSQKGEHVPNHSQAPQMIPLGWRTGGCSNLSTYLKVKGLESEPIIGRAAVWECQGISQATFYLCESCKETLSLSDICQHLVSDQHWLSYIMGVYPKLLHFWSYEDLELWMKLEILKGIAKRLLPLERDVQFLLLRPELYKNVREAPFSEALNIVRSVKFEQRGDVPSCTPQQKEARQNNEQHHLEETAGDADAVKERKVPSPLDFHSASPKADSVVFTFAGADTCLSPQEPPEPTPPVSQCQSPLPELQLKQTEVHTKFPSSSIDNPETSQTLPLSASDKCLPTIEEPAVGSIETLVRCCNNPQLEDPLPATCERTCSELAVSQPSPEVVSESTSVHHAATSTVMSPKGEHTGCGSDERDSMDWTSQLLALVRARKSELHVSPCQSAPDKTVTDGDSETTTSCNNTSSESRVGGRWDSKWWPFKVAKNYSLPDIFSKAAPAVSDPEHQLFTPDAKSEGATEAKVVGTMFPSVSTVDPSNPQQRGSDAPSTLGNASQSDPSPICSEVPNNSLGLTSQPQDYETDSTLLPINTVVSDRQKPPEQQFISSGNGQGHTEVDMDYRVPSPAATVNPSDSSGGYSQYSQMAYVANRQSGYYSSPSAGSYTTADHPPGYAGSSYQWQGYSTQGFYPNQIHPTHEANCYSLQTVGHTETPPTPEWVQLGMQQQQLLLLEQQYSSWTNAHLAAADSRSASQAAYVGAAPFAPPASNSQTFIDPNQYSTNRVCSTQNSNMTTQTTPQAYLNPMVIYYPTAANADVSSQVYGNFFYSDKGM